MQDMLFVVVAEALQTVHHQACGIAADGAVGGVDDTAGGFFDDVNGLHGGGTVKYLGNQLRQLPQADTAGHALAAGLCMAKLQKAQRHIHRTQTRGTGGNAPLDVTIQIIHHSLCTAGRFDIKSAQCRSTPFLPFTMK